MKLGAQGGLESGPLWYKDAIIYELHVRAFFDSNGDGIGDFPGLVQKLDYLHDLGVTALWLLPFYPSPLRDDGYDIADYSAINPIYGKMADFKRFLREAHRRGLRVITELVVNHTSDQHAWFQRARQAPRGSRWRDFYVWSDTDDKYREARIIFKDFETSNWAWDEVANAYYWHRFYSHQPDLNYDNPAVQTAVLKAMDFWLGMGIDGLRLDAIPYLYEREGTNCENLPETHTFLKKLRRHVDDRFPDRMLLAEANQWPEDSVAYFGEGDECHMAFHFPVMPRLFMAIRMEDRFPIIDILQQTPAIAPTCQWAMFLRNHDELTLEMVTDEDRDYMYRVYAQDAQARINLGIRRRLAPLLDNHRGKIELMNALLFSLPGTPVLYYGDEIGMGDNIYLGDRNGVRTPMQWSAERNAGFSRANPQRLYLPVIIDPEYHFLSVNVETQQNNSHSLLWWTKHLIALRKRFRAFGRGSLEFLSPDNPRVLAFLRAYEDERILVVANLSRHVQYVELDLAAYKGAVPVEMLGRTTFPPIGDLPYLLTLGPYACYWFALDWFAPELQRPEAIVSSTPVDARPVLTVMGEWSQVFRGSARATLEAALPAYLKGRPWFSGRARVIDKVELFETVPVFCGNEEVYYSLVRITYREGDPELYALPLGFATGKQAESIQAHLSHTVVARLKVRRSRPGKEDRTPKITGPVPFSGPTSGEEMEVDGLLFDAIEESSFAKGLLRAISRRRRFRGPSSEVQAGPLRNGLKLFDGLDTLPEPTVARATTENTTLLAFGDRWFLKVFRRLEEEVNPELEIGRFLTEKTEFKHILPVAGAIEYCRGAAAAMPLAVLQGFVAHQGTAWQLALDALGRYFQRVLTLPIKVQDLPLPHRSLLDLVEEDIPQLAQETLESFLPGVQLLGQRSGELHVALASDRSDPAFAPEPFTTLYQRSLYQSVRTQARRAMDLLRKRQKDLPEPVRQLASRVLDLEAELLKRLRHQVLEGKISAGRARCHCDFHLSEVLYTGKDFVFIDFEGDPHRPPSARRHKRSPLRDVASMIRSFHYAALTALATGSVRSEDVPSLQPWVQVWHLWVSVAFLKGYLKVAEQDSFLPTDREERRRLLDFFLLKRAANELRFELLHNPDQVQVPLKGLLQLLEAKE